MSNRKIPPFSIEPPAAGFSTVGALFNDLQRRREWAAMRSRPVPAFAAALLAAASPARRRAGNVDLAQAGVEVLQLLRTPNVEPWKAKDIVERVTADVSEATIHGILRQLVARGAVVKTGRTHGAAYRAAVLDDELTERQAWATKKSCDHSDTCNAPISYGHRVCPECNRAQNVPKLRSEAAA